MKLFTVPNIITCFNLIAGCMSIICAFNYNFLWSFLFILIGAGFDFFDGLTARILKSYSDIGKELDSLVDMVSFGMAPAFSLFCFAGYYNIFPGNWSYIMFLIPVFSALRLAKFNIDTRQTEEFIGLATPANAIFFGSLTYLASTSSYRVINYAAYNYIIISILVVLFCILMVSEIKMFSFKFKNTAIRGNLIRYIFVIFTVGMALLLDFAAIPVVIMVYIATSIAKNLADRR